MIVCARCRRFVKVTRVVLNGFDEVIEAKAECKQHGEVEPTGWTYEELVGQLEIPA